MMMTPTWCGATHTHNVPATAAIGMRMSERVAAEVMGYEDDHTARAEVAHFSP